MAPLSYRIKTHPRARRIRLKVLRDASLEVVTPPGIYRIRFDISRYAGAGAKPFFPEIDIVFRADDDSAHYHVPVVMSPYGYSSYRGN